jgi:hypothetical protein
MTRACIAGSSQPITRMKAWAVVWLQRYGQDVLYRTRKPQIRTPILRGSGQRKRAAMDLLWGRREAFLESYDQGTTLKQRSRGAVGDLRSVNRASNLRRPLLQNDRGQWRSGWLSRIRHLETCGLRAIPLVNGVGSAGMGLFQKRCATMDTYPMTCMANRQPMRESGVETVMP